MLSSSLLLSIYYLPFIESMYYIYLSSDGKRLYLYDKMVIQGFIIDTILTILCSECSGVVIDGQLGHGEAGCLQPGL